MQFILGSIIHTASLCRHLLPGLVQLPRRSSRAPGILTTWGRVFSYSEVQPLLQFFLFSCIWGQLFPPVWFLLLSEGSLLLHSVAYSFRGRGSSKLVELVARLCVFVDAQSGSWSLVQCLVARAPISRNPQNCSKQANVSALTEAADLDFGIFVTVKIFPHCSTRAGI